MPPRSQTEKVPSGYDSSEYLVSDLSVDASVLPWLDSMKDSKFMLVRWTLRDLSLS